MPRAKGRASQTLLDSVHRETARAVLTELKRLRKAGEPVSAALLTAATSLLKATGTVDPERPRNRADRLSNLLDEYEAGEAAEGRRPKTGRGSRGPRTVDFGPVPTDDTVAREFPEE